MPVVLTTAPGVRRSGHLYDDRTGIAYEFPAGRYERWIVQGERFVYCEPRRGYFGCGLLGSVVNSTTSGRRVAEVATYDPFDDHVPLKDADGVYYEADPAVWKARVYWAQGVRPLGPGPFEAILRAASTVEPLQPVRPTPKTAARLSYGASEVAAAVERYSVEAVLGRLGEEFPGVDIIAMPRNNPGFDIRVGPTNAPLLLVEVKGTQSAEPVFFMSEGERDFSVRNAARYRLEVVVGIDLAQQSHQAIHQRTGAVGAEMADLKVAQWRGALLADRTRPAAPQS